MKKKEVVFDEAIQTSVSLKYISLAMDKKETDLIDNVPWANYAYEPTVSFAMAHGKDCVAIKFYVIEKNTKAVYWKTNEPVYKDSCVEFFVTFDEGKSYYNFEFNCVGTCLVGHGPNKQNRILLDDADIQKIQLLSAIESNTLPDNEKGWELTAIIPFAVFKFDKINSLQGTKCKGNFYKCGDDLASPHYVCWNKIESEQPNFHLPAYFGEIDFI